MLSYTIQIVETFGSKVSDNVQLLRDRAVPRLRAGAYVHTYIRLVLLILYVRPFLTPTQTSCFLRCTKPRVWSLAPSNCSTIFSARLVFIRLLRVRFRSGFYLRTNSIFFTLRRRERRIVFSCRRLSIALCVPPAYEIHTED